MISRRLQQSQLNTRRPVLRGALVTRLRVIGLAQLLAHDTGLIRMTGSSMVGTGPNLEAKTSSLSKRIPHQRVRMRDA